MITLIKKKKNHFLNFIYSLVKLENHLAKNVTITDPTKKKFRAYKLSIPYKCKHVIIACLMSDMCSVLFDLNLGITSGYSDSVSASCYRFNYKNRFQSIHVSNLN